MNKHHMFILIGSAVAGYFLASTLASYPPYSFILNYVPTSSGA